MNTQMYVLRTREGTIHAPVGSPQLRRLSIRADVAAVFDLLGEQVEVPSRSSAWVRRYRALAEKLRTSDLFEAAEVFRDLSGRRLVKELSCGERGLRDRARSLLVDELTVVMGVDAEEVDRRIHQALAQAQKAA